MTLPTGTVTFLFTDIEGSTKLWETQPDAMQIALERHDVLLRNAIETNGGHVFKTIGDAFCAAFHAAADGVNAALEAHLALQSHEWSETGPLRVRMGLHTGEARERDNDYFGPTLNRTARLQGVAHGQQTLITQATYELIANRLPDGCRLGDLGMHRLKDLAAPEHVWQLLHHGLPQEFAPLKTLDYLPTNLPRQLTSFIGREKEMVEIEALLQKTSLLTLTGSGGCGKTRLAVQTAAEVLERYVDGVWLVELAPLSDAGLVPQTLAQALNIREAPGEPITTTLLTALKDKHMLLVLDNCEHVMDACANLADAIVRQSPRVVILATSRQALRITGELTYRVPSLSVPDPKQAQLPDQLPNYEAVRLFIERARAVWPDFTVTDQNFAPLASLCYRLDGIALAIELAAARMRAMSVEQVEARLDGRFRLLTDGSRSALPRQQTLRALIDWSYDLLTEQEKVLLQRVSVFAGGWKLEAAEAVCGNEGGWRREGEGENQDTAAAPTLYPLPSTICGEDVLDLLTSLVDKSLVVYDGSLVEPRYRLLDTVRQYAGERQSESGGSTALRDLHLDHYLAQAQEPMSNGSDSNPPDWMLRMEADHENLRAALNWSLSSKDGRPTALLLCGALWRFWDSRGYLSEGLDWCVRALQKADTQERAMQRVEVLIITGHLASDLGDYVSGRGYYEAGLKAGREVGDRRSMGTALLNLGNLACYQADYAEARAYYLESREIMSSIGERRGVADVLMNLGNLACYQGDFGYGKDCYEESLAVRREIGSTKGIAICLMNLGNVALSECDYTTARVRYEESIAILREIGDRHGAASPLLNLGSVLNNLGDHVAALAHTEEGLTILREIGDQSGVASSLSSMGTNAFVQGDYVSARAYQAESMTIWKQIGDRRRIAETLEAFAYIAARDKGSDQATALWGAAETLRLQIGSPLMPNQIQKYDREVAELKQVQGEQAFTAAWENGRRMTMEEAIALALNQP